MVEIAARPRDQIAVALAKAASAAKPPTSTVCQAPFSGRTVVKMTLDVAED